MSRLSERIENYNKAFNILQKSIDAYNNDKNNEVIHMALIQSFEVCFELGWKALKDYLKLKDVMVNIPRDVIKEAFFLEIIKNGQIWIDMQKDRNISSHEYNFDKINTILEKISGIYYLELKNFSDWLGEING